MTRCLALLGLLSCTLLAMGQEVKTGLGATTAKAPASTRMGVINAAFDERVGQQKGFLFEEGDFPRIIHILRWQCDLDHRNYELWTDLIWMWGNIEAREDELATAVEFRTLNPDEPEAWYPEAQVHYFRRNFLKVVPLLETSIAIGRPHPNNYRLLAQAWNRLGFTKQAIRVWELMLKAYPGDERARTQLDRARQQLNGPK
jgi:tetratricopeptide (TPR) repeat protein